jgi:FliG C-terminal domain
MNNMLSRYRRPGGFLQLLALIESFGSQKREKFMQMIQDEDPAWAKAISSKALSMERIFGWPEQTISEIFRHLPVKNVALIMKSTSPANAEKVFKFLSHAEKRKLDDEMALLESKPEEVFATIVKVIEVTRKMIKEGELRIEKVDPDMVVPESFESTLGPGPALPHSHGHGDHVMEVKSHEPDTHHHHAPPQESLTSDVIALQKHLAAAVKENRALKEEIAGLRNRLDQIKKIA